MSLKSSHFSFPSQSIFYYFAGGGGRWGCYTIHSPLSVRVSTLYLSTSSLFTPSLSLSFLISLRLSLSLQIPKTTSSSLCEKSSKTLIIHQRRRLAYSAPLFFPSFFLRNVEKVSILGAQSLSPSLLRSIVFNLTRRLRLWLRSPRPRPLQLVRVQCLSLQT